jgi:flagellar basal-body rod modification protein FlgD
MSTVTAPSAYPSSLTTGTSTAPTSQAQQSQSQFLQLLVAQLKQQDPLNPLDGTQFVTQLAQFSSLEQLISIRTDLDGMAKTTGATTQSAAATPTTSTTTPQPSSASTPSTTPADNNAANPFQGA